jgi:HD-GYP domain-containing protein (c-di-GMP phosphodiesterase class II)
MMMRPPAGVPSRNVNAAFTLASLGALILCTLYTLTAAYIAPYSGLDFGADWIIQRIGACPEQDPICSANRDLLQTGDRLLSIGGLTNEAYLRNRNVIPFSGYQTGEIISITFLRAGRVHTVFWQIPRRSASVALEIMPQFFVYAPFWAAGTIILLVMRPRDQRWRLLIFFNYGMAIYLAVGLGGTFLPYAYLAIKTLSWLLMPVYLHLHLIIPSQLIDARNRKYLNILYLSALMLAGFEILNVLPDRTYYLGLIVTIAGCLSLLAYRLFSKITDSERLALRLMFIGIGLALGPSLILWILPFLLARVPASTSLIFSILAIPLLPIFYMYAIYRRHLGGFEFRANRALSLYVFSLLFALAIVVVFSIASRSLRLQDQSLYFSLAVTLIFVIIAPPLRTRFQRWFDAVMYGARHDPQEIVRDFALQLPAAFEPAQLIRLLSREVTPSLLIRESALYQKAESGFSLFYADGIDLPKRPMEFAEMEALLRNAGEYRPPDRSGTDRFAWVRLAVALQTGGKTGGIWLFGRRDPDDFYPQPDILLLRTLGSQVAPMLDNLRLYDETQRRLERLQTLRDIDITISSSLDLNFTLEILLDQVSRRSNVDAVDVLLHNGKTNLLEFVAGKGFHSDALHHTHLRLGEGYAGQAAHERRLIFIPNLEQEVGSLARSPKFPSERFKSYCAAPLIVKGQVKGVLEVFFRTPLAADADWFDFLESLTVQAAIAIDNASLFDELQHSNAELNLAYDTTIEGWSRALDLRDEGTEGHTERVTEMTERLARAVGMEESHLVHVRRGALLHDMGKMGIPDSILLKRDALSREEWDIMRRHPLYAYEMLSPIIYLRQSLDIPYCHHEKWDGTGYPRGLKGEQIPLAARIFAIVDVWDATTSDRPYRQAWTKTQAREYIVTQSGKHFDPQIAQTFLSIVD